MYENSGNEGEEHPELAPDDDGQAKWKMEFNTPGGIAPSIGIPQSQIMDTGPIGNQGTASTTASSSTAGPSGSGIPMPRSPGPKTPPTGCLQCECARLKVSPETDRAKRYEPRRALVMMETLNWGRLCPL